MRNFDPCTSKIEPFLQRGSSKAASSYRLSLMKRTIYLALIFILLASTQAEVVYSDSDQAQAQKEELLNELITIMGDNGAVNYVAHHEKYVLWTNKAAVLFNSAKNEYQETELPSFTMVSNKNAQQLQMIFKEQTGMTLTKDQIGGILIASTNQGAIMYYRQGYLPTKVDRVDSKVAPAVIIYHEFSHVKDSLLSPYYFSDMATQFDKRYKNHAERSAVQQQNDFVLTAKSIGLDVGGLRQSDVASPWTIP
jgi:hypothetical protein